MPRFAETLREQRLDDHRLYHHSRINQALHLVSASSFLAAYVLLLIDPPLAALVAWLVGMTSRQIGAAPLMPLTLRSIGNYPVRGLRRRQYNGCYDRHAVPMWEKVHVSLLQRLGETIEVRERQKELMNRYLPQNLIEALPVIRATYHDKAPDVPASIDYQIRLVDWDGEEFLPDDPQDCADALAEVGQAVDRMK